ncbi:MAG: ribonuclease R, partial [Bacteroidales bacterium]
MARHGKKLKRTRATNSFENTVLNVFLQDPLKSYNFRQLSHAMGIQDSASKQLVKDILVKLEGKNEIVERKRGKYQLNPAHPSLQIVRSDVSGIVDMKQTGKAYIISDDLPEDVFIASNNTYHALHGDKVNVHLFPRRKGRKLEGRIVEILERKKKQFVGIVEVSNKFAFLIPDDNSIPVDIFIPLSSLNGAKNGNKAIARIT